MGYVERKQSMGVLVTEEDVSSHLGFCHCVLIVEGSGHDPGGAGLDLRAALFTIPLELCNSI